MKLNPGAQSLVYACRSRRTLRLNRQSTPKSVALALMLILCSLAFSSNVYAQATSQSNLHRIEMFAEKLGEDYFAYKMLAHTIADMDGNNEIDVTGNYPGTATIPGPTIIINEGDEVVITLSHAFDPDSPKQEHVSVHVHGVHYDILSDGTLKYINLVEDESATPTMSYTYRWVAAPGTAGTWPYHDHNMNTLNGAEDRGLFGTLIVNSKSNTQALNIAGKIKSVPLSSIQKEYVLYIGDDAFWGTEIDNHTGQQTPLWVNPPLSAHQGSNVRFHLIALGTNFHQFALPGYGWIDPGTNVVIHEKAIGPLEKHVFTIQADNSSHYMDNTFTSKLLGMKADFNVIP